MIGEGYWASSIILDCHQTPRGGWSWSATTSFYDNGFAVADDPTTGRLSTAGKLATCYWVPGDPQHQGLRAVIDVVKADAERLGIAWRDPAISLKGDGEDHSVPDDWRELLAEQANRLGWDSYL